MQYFVYNTECTKQHEVFECESFDDAAKMWLEGFGRPNEEYILNIINMCYHNSQITRVKEVVKYETYIECIHAEQSIFEKT